MYEAAPFAGGRCRSFIDRDMGVRIDNGNHLVLSGNEAVHDYLFLTNALETMGGPGAANFPFFDVEARERWTVSMSNGVIPWWLFNKSRRIPGTKPTDYLSSMKLLLAGKDTTVSQILPTQGVLYKKFWEPLVIGALNTEPEHASAELLASVVKQSFALGGAACIPLIPKIGLSETFVLPCLNVLRANGVEIKYYHRLRALLWEGDAVRQLDFNGNPIEVGMKDWVILALPAWFVRDILPDVSTPTDFRSIISAHFRVDDVIPREISFTGFVSGIGEWCFVRNGVASVTISCAERYRATPTRDLVPAIWREVALLYDLDPEFVPTHKIFLEKYATFAATPQQNALRPTSYTGWKNLALAGEWTATGLPSTIEGAIRSGMKAAQVVMRWMD